VRDVQGCYELSGIQGTSETVPPPATLDEAAGVSVVSARYILTPDRMYTSSYVVSYGEGGIKTSASVFAVGSFRLHKDQVITVDGKGNESTLTFDKALQRLTASDLPPEGPWPHVLPTRVHVFDRQTCFEMY